MKDPYPDACVVGTAEEHNCVYARGKTHPTQCEYWQAITPDSLRNAGVAESEIPRVIARTGAALQETTK